MKECSKEKVNNQSIVLEFENSGRISLLIPKSKESSSDAILALCILKLIEDDEDLFNELLEKAKMKLKKEGRIEKVFSDEL